MLGVVLMIREYVLNNSIETIGHKNNLKPINWINTAMLGVVLMTREYVLNNLIETIGYKNSLKLHQLNKCCNAGCGPYNKETYVKQLNRNHWSQEQFETTLIE